MTRQNQTEFADEIARQAELYKNMRMPKSQAGDFTDESEESA